MLGRPANHRSSRAALADPPTGVRPLSDFRPVGNIIGWLTVVLGGLMLLPLLIDIVDGSGNAHAFAGSALVTIFAGATVALACGRGGRASLNLRQGFLLVSGCWLVLPALGALPLMVGAPHLGLTDAYFETMSAMTTTGATVIAGLDEMPRGLLLWRGLLQWMGGIGVVLMAIIILPVLGVGGMQLARTADFNTLEKILPRAKDIAISFGSAYLALTLGCALGYLLASMTVFDAIVHAMTTLATGGMGNYDASFASFTPAAQYVSTLFMLLGSMSFVRYVQFARGQARPLFTDTQIRAFLLVYAAFCLGVAASRLLNGERIGEPELREVLFNMASVLSTTGYASTDYNQWGSFAAVLILCFGMICGCSGSTAGGPKVFRYQIMLTEIRAELQRLHAPHRVMRTRHQGRRITPEVLNSVMAFFMMFFLSLGIGSVLLVLLGLSPITAISGAATCLSNIGPGLGPEIGPAGNFAGLPPAAKWVLSVLMLAGRLEILSIYALFLPGFWRR
jgi:trk system potassium uptake protein